MSESASTRTASPFRLERAWILSLAASAIILGIIALVWPDVAIQTIALIFGTYLILAGIYRVVLAFASENLSALMRWSTGVLGAFVVIAGILTLNNSFASIVIMTYVIGIGWILAGITDLMGGWRGSYPAPRWLILLGGVLSILAGFAIMLLTDLVLSTFIIVAGLLLIVAGIGVAITLPDLIHRIAAASAAAAASEAAEKKDATRGSTTSGSPSTPTSTAVSTPASRLIAAPASAADASKTATPVPSSAQSSTSTSPSSPASTTLTPPMSRPVPPTSSASHDSDADSPKDGKSP